MTCVSCATRLHCTCCVSVSSITALLLQADKLQRSISSYFFVSAVKCSTPELYPPPHISLYLWWTLAALNEFIFYLLLCRRPRFNSWVRKICWRRDRLPSPVFFGFPCGSADKESACNEGDLGSTPGLGRSPGEGKGYPLQFWPVQFWPGLYRPWGQKKSDTTEWLSLLLRSEILSNVTLSFPLLMA